MLSGYWLEAAQRAPAQQGRGVNCSLRRAEAAAKILFLRTRDQSRRPESSRGTRRRRQGHSTLAHNRRDQSIASTAE